MNMHEKLFAQALQIQEPWYVEKIDFDHKKEALTVQINFKKGSTFACTTCGKEAKAYDTKEKILRHLNFFQYNCELVVRVPRIKCKKHGVLQVEIPFARPRASFTFLFESLAMTLCREMPINAVARILGEDDEKLWRMVSHYVNEARDQSDYSEVKKVGVDETSKKKGHNYVSVFVDLDERKTLYVTEGKDASTITEFRQDLEKHGGKSENIDHLSMDMSPSFIKGAKEEFPEAEVTFDRYHVIKLLNKAVDEVRRKEVKENELFKKTRYIWLKNRNNHTTKQRRNLLHLESITKLKSKTIKAYHIKETFQEIYRETTKKGFLHQLNRWYFWATHSKIKPIINAAKIIKNHWDGVVQWFESRITNGMLEGFNSLIQATKAKARGYRSFKNFSTIIYLLTGKLDFSRITHTK